MRAKFVSAVAAGLALAVVLSGCGGDASDARSAEEEVTPLWVLAEETLGDLAGVDSVRVGHTPSDPTTDGTQQEIDPSDPDLWNIDIAVHLNETVDVAQAVAVGEATLEFSEKHAGAGRWSAHLTMGGGGLDESDLVTPPRVQVRLYPHTTAPADSIPAAFAGASIDGVTSVAIGDGWPTVHLADATAFAPAHAALQNLPPFTEGARYSTPDGRLVLVDVPERVSAEALVAIARLAVEHPQADFALEAGYDGPRWPQLYVNRIAEAELDGLLAALNDPALADADPEGYPLEYFVRSFTDEGSLDVGGALGAVPVA